MLTLRMRSFSACIKFHDRENMPDTDGICVANHTSPIGTSTFVTLNAFMAEGFKTQGLRNATNSCLSTTRTNVVLPLSQKCPPDVVILSVDRPYALVGQSHPGFMGVIQRSLSRGAAHIWFQRSEAKDRLEVARRLREHVEDLEKLPILIFPEGTCINNTVVMQFKKGSFEVS